MAVTGVSNLAELISNQSLGQGQDAPATAQPVQSQGASAPAPEEDNFTSSTQSNSVQATAQDAGLFQVSQFALSSATAEILSAQTGLPQASQSTAPAQAAQTTAAVAAATQVASISTSAVQTPAPVVTQATALTPPASLTAASLQVDTNLANPNVSNTPGEPQSMNSELLGLGLSNNDIQDIDRVASLSKDFNPIVYNDLIQQFETQAAQEATLTAGGAQPVTSSKVTTT